MEPPAAPTDRGVAALRQDLVDELKRAGHIRTLAVEAAFRAVPRHLFLPGEPLEEVYRNRVIPVRGSDGQWKSSASQPDIVTEMLEALALEPGHRVLEIGAGTGFNAALIACIVGETGHVVTVDLEEDLVANARRHLQQAGFGRVQVICGDGADGYPTDEPYDRIILTVGADDIAPAWYEQLRTSGRLLLPLGLSGVQKVVAFEKANTHLVSVSVQDAFFMRLRGTFAGPDRDLQLGPGSDVTLSIADPSLIDAGAAYRWLNEASRDYPTSVRATPSEVRGGLRLWLALREPGFCDLSAQGALAVRGIVPSLDPLLSDSPGDASFTCGVVSPSGLCVLASQLDPAASLDPLTDTPCCHLMVRSFGTDEALARHLIGQIRAWNNAGCPATKDFQIRGYPPGTDYVPASNEAVVDKKWMRLVCGWL
jgi:protein-L-isoaspartate(D-aspartate) O-methyltransferase